MTSNLKELMAPFKSIEHGIYGDLIMVRVKAIFYLLKGDYRWPILQVSLAGYSATPASGVWRFGRRRDDHDTQGVTFNAKSRAYSIYPNIFYPYITPKVVSIFFSINPI